MIARAENQNAESADPSRVSTRETNPRETAPTGANPYDTMRQVPPTDTALWEGEGWGVFDSDGVLEIQADGEAARFASDEEAIAYVLRMASTGSRSHLLALWLDGRPAYSPTSTPGWLPAELLVHTSEPNLQNVSPHGHLAGLGAARVSPNIEMLNVDESAVHSFYGTAEDVLRSIDLAAPPTPPQPQTGFADS